MAGETALIGRYEAYPEYKDTNVFWLGSVPEHWVLSKLKFVKDIIPNAFVDGPFGSNLKSSHIVEGGDIYVIESNFATQGILDEKKLKTITLEHFETICRSEAREGDIIIAKIGAQYGKASILPSICKRAVVSGNSLKLSINEVIFSKLFAHYVFLFLKESGAFDDIVNATAQPALSLGDLNNIPFPFPWLSEQEKIANFLDHETAKIDTLIDKQQQLITLLKEKRQAVISHAVTKGLNPEALMRNSGVEWLGEVPAHWDVCRLKQTIKSGSSISYGIVQPGEPLEEGVAFVQTTNMSKGTFDLVNLQKTTKEIAKAYPRSTLVGGEVILGIRASIGAAFVVPESLRGCNLSRGVARIIPSEHMSSEYLVAYFGTGAVERYWGLSKQGSTFSEVSIETVRELSLPVPPVEEQKQIAKWIDERITRLDDVFQKAMEQTVLLNERRTALISAAVTGKIDVRNWKAA
jgi:type I restriction enzyme S subunit